ncbi:MAG: amidohydrolase family protein [Phycisphaerales bacterium]|nr:amidohydrolase family protein [Phycisphaerales bacterium]
MLPKHALLLTAFATFFAAASLATDDAPAKPNHYTIVRCGTLLAVPGQPAKSKQTVVIKNGIIESVRDGLEGPDLKNEAVTPIIEEVDLRDKFVLPGLIDCHVHLTMEFDAALRMRDLVESDGFTALRATTYARRNLDAGFTTVRDLGSGRAQVILDLRDAIKAGFVVGPRVVAAGHAISITGGHGDGTTGFREGLFLPSTPEGGIADGPDECRKAVRNQIKLGADVIKVTATGGVLSAAKAGLAQQYFDDELDAIVTTAHSLQRKVAAHAHGVDGINAAIRAGVDSVEHGTYLDDDSIALFKGRNCYHVPTLLASATVAANAEVPGFYLPQVAEKARLVAPKSIEMFRKSHEAGVKIAFGTDTGVSPHGQNAREFALMVQGGMTPTEAIRSATIVASELLGLEKEIGTIEPGKTGDLIAVKGDPTKDVTELERVACVVKAGSRVAPVTRQ